MLTSDAFWLTLTNILLGAGVAICILIAVLGEICQALLGVKKRRFYRAELDHDMQEMFATTAPLAGPTEETKPGCVMLQKLCRICQRLFHRSK